MAITRKSLATRGAKWLAILTLAGCMSPTLGYAQEIPLAAVDAAVMASSNETGLARAPRSARRGPPRSFVRFRLGRHRMPSRPHS